MNHKVSVIPHSLKVGEDGLKIVHHTFIHLLISDQDVTNPDLNRCTA